MNNLSPEQYASLSKKLDELLEGDQWLLVFSGASEEGVHFAGSIQNRTQFQELIEWLDKHKDKIAEAIPE